MRRVESDPEEVREIEEALSRQATPTHEQDTIEFDSLAVIRGLGLRLREPPELGFERIPEDGS
jgi:hypothetical protein